MLIDVTMLLETVNILIFTYRVFLFEAIYKKKICHYFILFDDLIPFLLIYLQKKWEQYRAPNL